MQDRRVVYTDAKGLKILRVRFNLITNKATMHAKFIEFQQNFN